MKMKLLFENWRKFLNEFAIAPYSQMNRNIKPQKPEEEKSEEEKEEERLLNILTEAAKEAKDLPENWFVKITKESSIIRADLVEKNSAGGYDRIPGRADPFSTVQAMHSSHPMYRDMPCLGAYIIQKSSAPAGFGPFLYDVVMELAGEDGLTPDRSLVSGYAYKVWEYYLKNRSDIEKKQLDDIDNPQTPPPEDDCKMYSTMDYVGELEGESTSWQESPLSKVYYKNNTDLITQLEAVGKIIHDDAPPEEEPEFVETEDKPFDPSNPEEWDFLEDLDENKANEDTDKVAKVVIYNKNGNILLLKRADNRNDWDLPGGHLKKSENYEEGAVRETKEETNLPISHLKHVHDHEKTKFFKCPHPKGNISLQKEEHVDFKWVNPKEIDQFQIRKSLKNAILHAIEVVNEDFQSDVKKKHTKMKIRLIGKGGNKKTEGPGVKKPSYKRSKSAPGGFGGA